MKRGTNIEAVTVCCGYDDFLREAARYNIPHFDRWIIVTEPQDEKTREVCRKFNLEVILTEDGRRHGTPFNKGRMIERGLQHTSSEGFRIHIDADMVLPHRFVHLLEIADLQNDFIYGIDRILCQGWDQWQQVQRSKFLMGGSHEYHFKIAMNLGLDFGARWAHPVMGYCPIGAFQMWHSSEDEWRGIRQKPYPMHHGNACRSDVKQALRFDRHKRALIPEIVAIHLESEAAKMGANWNGRTTKRFGPDSKPGPFSKESC